MTFEGGSADSEALPSTARASSCWVNLGLRRQSPDWLKRTWFPKRAQWQKGAGDEIYCRMRARI